MYRKRLIKLLGLNLGVAAANIITFSPGLIGIELGASALAKQPLAAQSSS
ncbi:MAG: hypothetical protein ACE14P_13735 [Methanotrichaceae archaeon]